MGIRTKVVCDGDGCDASVEFSDIAFELGDLPTIDWICDIDNEFYYCPTCVELLGVINLEDA